MRGNPLIRLFLVVFLFVVAAFPLWKLTGPQTPLPPQSTVTVAPATALTQLEVTFSQPATEFTIRHLGEIIWKGKGLHALAEFPLPTQRFDLQIEASWNPVGEGENAFRIRVIRDEMPLIESTFWAPKQVEETLTIPAS